MTLVVANQRDADFPKERSNTLHRIAGNRSGYSELKMGREQRSRRHIPEGTLCYLCGQPILSTDEWNRDHLPPERFFAKSVKRLLNPQLEWLYTHRACNSAYREDEEYLVTFFAGQAQSKSGGAVMDDLHDAFQKGHSQGLIKAVIQSFGTVIGPGGEVTFEFNKSRVDRIIWKIVRGIYYRDLGIVLPEGRPGFIRWISRQEAPAKLPEIEWYPMVRDTPSLGSYPDVFDYKWVSWKDGDLRGHAVGMLLWDGLIVLVIFHDPACCCPECVRRQAA